MAQCEYLAGCPFFKEQMPNMPAKSDGMKLRYCLCDNAKCARYIMIKAVGRERVPPDLFPDQLDVARDLLSKLIRCQAADARDRSRPADFTP